MDREQLRSTLEQHRLWLNDKMKGKKADLSGADLSGADLRGADLSEADLRGADLSGTKHVVSAGYCNGFHVFGYWTETGIIIRAGCRTKLISYAKEYWNRKEDRREILAAIDFIETMFKIRGLS